MLNKTLKYFPTYCLGNQDILKLEIVKFEKPLHFLHFDYKHWNRPMRMENVSLIYSFTINLFLHIMIN